MAGFADVLGHEQTIAHMKKAIELGKVSHAYIINGEKGSGKKLLAGIFAQTLQCQEKGTEPCMHCQSCLQAQSMNQPDIIRVTHEKPNTISVEDIRGQLNGDIQIKPYSSPYKIYIVDEAEKLSPQAQNALLKTIGGAACLCSDPASDSQYRYAPADDSVQMCGAGPQAGTV